MSFGYLIANVIHDLRSKRLHLSEPEMDAVRIASLQSSCSENLKSFADKMASQFIHKLGEAQVGDTVQVPVPDVERPND